MIGIKFYKDNFNAEAYSSCAKWCNETQLATIEDKGEYYECVAIPQPSDEEKLVEAKEDKVAELKSIRDSLEVEPIQTDKGLFDYDQKAMDRINSAIIALSLQDGTTLEWTLADNTTATVTSTDLKMVVGAVAIRSNVLHNKYRMLKEQVMACETIEQVNAIEWSSIT